MAEFDELKLQITLVDNATAQLEVLKRSFAELGSGAQMQSLQNLRRSTNELGESMKRLIESIQKGPEGLIKFAQGFGAVGVAVAATALGIDRLVKSLSDMSTEVVGIGNLSRRIGMQPAETRAMIEIYERAGKSATTAGREVETFAVKMDEVRRGSAGVVTELRGLSMIGEDSFNRVNQFVDVLRRIPDLPSQWDAVREFAREEGRRAAVERGPGAAGPTEQAILRIWGIPESDAIKEDMKKAIDEVDAVRRASEARALAAGEKQLALTKSIEQQWKLIVHHMGFDLMAGPLGRGLTKMKELLDALEKATRPGGPPTVGGEPLKPPSGKSWWDPSRIWDPRDVEREHQVAPQIQWPKPNFPTTPTGHERGPTVPGMQDMPQPLMSTEGVAGFTGPYEPMRSWKAAADWAGQLHGEPSTNIERRDLLERQNDQTRELVNQMKRANALLAGEEKPAGEGGGLTWGGRTGGPAGGLGPYGRFAPGGGRAGGGGGRPGDGGGPYGSDVGPGVPSGTGRLPGMGPLGVPGAPISELKWPGGAPVVPQPSYPGSVQWPPSPLATPGAAPSAGTGGSLNETRAAAFQKMRDAAVAAGSPDPDMTAAIAMHESGYLSQGIYKRSGDTNAFGQTVKPGTPGAIRGADGQWHAVYPSLTAGVEDHIRRWGKHYVPGDPQATIKNLIGAGYNTANPEWGPTVSSIYSKRPPPSGAQPQTAQGPAQPQQLLPTLDPKGGFGGGGATSTWATGPLPATPEGAGEMRFSGGRQGIKPELYDLLQEASKSLPPGYTARLESGVGDRPGGSRSYHPWGLAGDVRIYGPDNKPVGGSSGWYQDPKTFRLYETFAQAAKLAQVRKYPNAPGFAWGGYFVNKGPGSYGFADLMHMQWGGPMAGGTWEQGATGVTRQWLERGGGTSAGIGQNAPLALMSTQKGSGAVPYYGISTGREILDEDRSWIDRMAAQRMRRRSIGSANIDVNVKSEGQKHVSQIGPFRKVRMSRDTAMEKADTGPPAPSEGSGGSANQEE
jgi:hypothetical protein